MRLERRVRSAAMALRAVDRRLCGTDLGSLDGVLGARATVLAVVAPVERGAIERAQDAARDLVHELRALSAALHALRVLRDARAERAAAPDGSAR